MFKNTYKWMGSRVYSYYADALLGLLFFLEAIFFIPTDPMLLFYCFERQERAYWFAAVATVSSVLGGITAYGIGFALWNHSGSTIIHSKFMSYIMTPETFSYLCTLYKQHEYWAICIAGFTPIPYKAATITAGFCQLSLIPFIFFSLLSRGARFFLYAYVIEKYGADIKSKLVRYCNAIIPGVTVLIIFIVWYLRS
jgi:membrane protein YqaA with SNARE-associated domain